MVDTKTAAILALRVYEEEVADINFPLDPPGWERLPNPLPNQCYGARL